MEKKTAVITIRLSPADKAAAIKAASAEGHKLSGWVAKLVRGNLTTKAGKK